MSKTPTLAMLPWWPRDYLAATRGFTLAERGAYTDLLFFSWDMESLPSDADRLARMLGVSIEDFENVWPAIRSKFEITQTGMVNPRLERERQNSLGRRTKAKEKAQAAAHARWKDAPSNARSNAPSIDSDENDQKPMLEAMLEQCPPYPAPYSSPDSASSLSFEGDARGNFRQEAKDSFAIAETKPETDDERIRTAIRKPWNPTDARVAKALGVDVDLVAQVRARL